MKARNVLRYLASLAVAGTVSWSVLVAILYLRQEQAMYPERGQASRMKSGWRKVDLPADGVTYHAYHLPAAEGMPTAIFLHGNATTYPGDIVATRGFAARGAGILVPEYPGYGGSPGSPTEAGILAQADRAYDWLVAQGVGPKDIIIYGNSIGAGPALHLALRPHALLTLVSPLGSMVDVVRRRMPYVPGFLVRDKWDNINVARRVTGPVIVMHARDDQTVPFDQGERLASAMRAKMMAFRDGGHGMAFDPAIAQMVAIDSLYVWRTGDETGLHEHAAHGEGGRGWSVS